MKQHHSKTKKFITFICGTSMTVLLIMTYYNDEFINIILSEAFKRWKNIFILLFINYYFNTKIRFDDSLDGQLQK